MNTLMIIIGWSASLMSLASSIPQTVKTYKNKTAEGVSVTMLFLSWLGIALLVLYCEITSTLIGGILNSINLFLFWIIFSLIIKYKGINNWQVISFLIFVFSALLVTAFIYLTINNIACKNNVIKWISIITASFLIAFCFVPQLIKTFKTKDVVGLSIWFFLFKAIGNILWITYWLNIAITKSLNSAFVAFGCSVFILSICLIQAYLTYYYRKGDFINTIEYN